MKIQKLQTSKDSGAYHSSSKRNRKKKSYFSRNYFKANKMKMISQWTNTPNSCYSTSQIYSSAKSKLKLWDWLKNMGLSYEKTSFFKQIFKSYSLSFYGRTMIRIMLLIIWNKAERYLKSLNQLLELRNANS